MERTNVAYKVQPIHQSLDVPFTFYLTPGHAPGHVVYHHDGDDVLICGDLFISSTTALHPPIYKFTYNMSQNIKSGTIIDDIQPYLISTSHGEDIVYAEELYQIYTFKYGEAE